jgi:hypothetical protein
MYFQAKTTVKNNRSTTTLNEQKPLSNIYFFPCFKFFRVCFQIVLTCADIKNKF